MIGVVFGPLGVLRNVIKIMGTVGLLRTAASDADTQYAIWSLVDAVVSWLLAAMLLWASIGVLRRRSWGRGAMIGYAIATLLQIAIAALILCVWTYPAAVAQTAPPGDHSLADIFLSIDKVTRFLWSLYPLCVLYCMTRARATFETSAAPS